jgi:hypothetical protein
MRITKNPPWFLVFESQSPERNLGAFGFIYFCELGLGRVSGCFFGYFDF